MNRGKIRVSLVALLVSLSLLLVLGTAKDSSAENSLTEQELDNLLAPIALYPDPLLSQLLPASTYPEEVADAAGWLRSGGDPSRIDEQNWDENVRAIAHYPTVLYMMADDMDWTASVGDAFLNQPEDVTNSIQRLRWQAQSLGNLVSNDQQTVTIDGAYIQIDPAQPQYIYVPQYDPSVIYVQSWTQGISPFITFGLGLAIGSWLDLDFDWRHHHVFYHGWNRPGWVDHARPYVHITNVYVQRSRPYINQTWRHNPAHGDPDRYWASRPGGAPPGRYPHTREVRGRTPAGPPGGMFVPGTNTQQFSNRGKESLRTVSPRPVSQAPAVSPRPVSQAPAVSPRPVPQAPAVSSRPAPPQAPTVFGGYRGSSEVKTQSMRGQASRQSAVGSHTPPAPVNRGGGPTSSGAPSGGRHR
ncbi:MAG TPA: DUF3300 domain-containing protein [Nitrospiraceae bacterium]|nr:DUF3300 domain-containing protein [Nitrospiraceae bacterium]